MNREYVLSEIKKHNESIDLYIETVLKKEFGETIYLTDWFKANDMLKSQRFYEKGMVVLEHLRSGGFDVKMNMQSNKLLINEYYEFCIDKIEITDFDAFEIIDTEIKIDNLTREDAYEKFNLIKNIGKLSSGHAIHINYFDGCEFEEIEEHIGKE